MAKQIKIHASEPGTRPHNGVINTLCGKTYDFDQTRTMLQVHEVTCKRCLLALKKQGIIS